VIGEEGLVDLRVAHVLLAEEGHDAVAGIDDLGAPAVIEGDLEKKSGIRGGLLLRVTELALHARIESVHAPDRDEADVVLHQRLQLFAEVLLEQHHQRGHFIAGPLPVLDGKRIERHHAELEPRRGLHDLAHGGDAGAMSFDARQAPRPRPAPVAVHDDGDVAREAREVDLLDHGLLDRARLRQLAHVDHREAGC
jgi:hypothetical protein